MSENVDIKVFTLNCWGIWGVSTHRVARMRAIAQHLADSDYDLVLLQEVWVPSDFEHICKVAKDALPFTHFFDQGIIGTGTCVLSKVPIVDAVFHEFSMNGYPHQVLHGDWFAGKGLGVVTLDFHGLNIHVFVSHLHAEYCRRKDIYLGHRVLQALEAAQWVKLTAPGADLTIYAGDFNTEPGDVPYRILRCVGGLEDAWEASQGTSGGGETCGTPQNTYCTIAEQEEYPRGKRIDYILHSAGRGRNCKVLECSLPLPPSIPASLAALVGTSCSYSDHEAVSALLRVSPNRGDGTLSGAMGDASSRRPTHMAEDAVGEGLQLVNAALRSVARHQKGYLVLALLAFLAFAATFAQILLQDSWLLAIGLFFLRFALVLFGLYSFLMATIFNRRERHALMGGKATLTLLHSRAGYGAI